MHASNETKPIAALVQSEKEGIVDKAKGGVIEGVAWDAVKFALFYIGGVLMTWIANHYEKIGLVPSIVEGIFLSLALFFPFSIWRERIKIRRLLELRNGQSVLASGDLRPPQITEHVERSEAAKKQEFEEIAEHKKTITALNEKIDAEANKSTKEIAWRQQELNKFYSMMLSGRNARALIEVRDRIRNTQFGLSRVTEWLEDLVKKPDGDDRIMREVRRELLGALSSMP